MSGTALDDAAVAAKRKRTRARARMILRIAATAMRGVNEMQSNVDKKHDELKQMREAAARGGPNSPSRHDQIAAVKELVALQREQKRAAPNACAVALRGQRSEKHGASAWLRAVGPRSES